MNYLLDTNTLIARLNGDSRIAERLRVLFPEEIVLCAPVLAELVFGAARRFGEVKSALRRRGIAKADFDLAIAVIAIERGAVLVTNDQALHDGAIEDLRVENWLANA